MPISAAFSTCSGVPPSTSVSAPAAIEHADPTSPWQPTSAPEIEAFALKRDADRGRREQEANDAVVVGARHEPRVVVQDGGDDAGGAVGRRAVAHGSGPGRHRWVVERGFAWLHAFKRLRTRYERRADLHLGLLRLACALICYRHLPPAFRIDFLRRLVSRRGASPS